MRCLWLTLADPEPKMNGQLIYSGGLIQAVAAGGAKLLVVGLDRHGEKDDPPRSSHNIRWQLHRRHHNPAWRRLVSPLPNFALYGASLTGRRAVDRALADEFWDTVVFDSINSGWALSSVLRQRQRVGRLVYLAHNCETINARRVADAARGVRRLARRLDTAKVAILERRLLGTADFVAADSPDDCEALAPFTAAGKVTFVPPGYDGPRVLHRNITESVPRRTIIVGSFNWLAKRESLERFLDAAASRLAAAGVELQIVGSAEPDYLAGLRRRYPSVTFVGPVANVRPYMAEARIALVPDLLGGFKLKGLDYVFNRVPILSMRGSLPGMPLEDRWSIGLFDSHVALAEGILSHIDSLDTLNTYHQRAFDACAKTFDWLHVGKQLISDISGASLRGR
jgi:glycosyltransferase involved in cell wall biosynthesis